MNFKLLSVLCFLGVLRADSWYDQKLEGWYYFQDREQDEKESRERPLSIDEAEEVLELEKRHLSKLLSLALLVPTPENTENYLLEQNRWVDQSARFAATWEKVLLQKPSLGDFFLNPTTSYGVLAKREIDAQKRKAFLKELSKSYCLLFFFRGEDPFSKKAAEIASLFASLNDWSVKAISLDGVGLETFKNFEVDKGISKNMGVTVSPSFFVLNPFTNNVAPVGAGLLSITDLEQNIEIQLEGALSDE